MFAKKMLARSYFFMMQQKKERKKKVKHIQMTADHPIRSWLIACHVLTFQSAI